MPEPIFGELADALLAPAAPLSAEAAELFQWLGLARPASPGPAEQHQARLFRAAAGFERLFQLAAPEAPGLVVWGAEASPDGFSAAPGHGLYGVSGAGTAPLEALNACIGEGIEILSQAETAADRGQQRPAPPPGQPPLDPPWDQAADGWMPTRRLADGAPLWLPAELCLRRPGATGLPWPLSMGCGAGATVEAAALHGLLELLERDAAALWWRGGQLPRPLPLEDPAPAAAARLLARLRRGNHSRRSWLLDLTTDLGVPAVAAVSVRPDGRGFCCGTAARLTLEAAARAAVRELAQMELALAVVAAKRAERGEAALNPRDRGHQARAEGIDAATCALLHPLAAPAPAAPPAPAEPAAALAWLVARLAEHGFAPCLLPLTRPGFAVPVCRVLCPGLATIPSEAMVPRLAAVIARTGGGDCYSRRIPLM